MNLGPALRDLHQLMLHNDPTLGTTSPAKAAPYSAAVPDAVDAPGKPA